MTIFPNNSNERIQEQAAKYMVRIHSTDFEDQDRIAFAAWLEADPRHRKEFSILAAVWDGMGQIVEEDREENISFASESFTETSSKRSLRIRGWPLAWGGLGVAASALLLVSLLGYFSGGETNAYATDVGDSHTVVMADGSVLHLNARTSVEWTYSSDTRRVNLQYGEALFDVIHDPDRPFIVAASQGEIEAIGTRFNVYYKPTGDVVVTVLDGTVRVQQVQANSPDPIWERTLEVSEEIAYREAGMTSDVTTLSSASERTSWRDGVIVLRDQTLLGLVEELNRYSPQRIAILDPGLNEIRLGGVVSIQDIPETLEFLEETAPVRTIETSDAYLIVPAYQ